ncbi:hypothetical protein DPMN_055549 [Dreissena polymorpha]|uniref:Uncharacterized protein n=1 Tax=Dreissena polymorpha TaxID=45954 RepID=A0A9D4CS20_DREPO|nr:hypothetical protein DPMN_055549 [Dreissena polymorpha]
MARSSKCVWHGTPPGNRVFSETPPRTRTYSEHCQKLLQKHQHALHNKELYNILDTASEGDCNRLHCVSSTIHRRYESHHQSRRQGVKGTEDPDRYQTSTTEGIYG